MGFHVELNSILRSDAYGDLTIGQELLFEKTGSRVFFDDIPIWLTRSDWTALAEIQVTQQTRTAESVTGRFAVQHVYQGEEQQRLTAIFRRMYADQGDPFVYVLMSYDTLQEATASGSYSPESLRTEGFIHASPKDQLTRVANKYYSGFPTVFVVVVRKTKLISPLKWEPATGGLYPHIYGPLNMEAAERVVAFPKINQQFHISFQT
ncbi:MAG: DUF952 domain-containing protein [Pirellulaceae bacterium]|nr:DUF952 domain-containing protein [Planctomycetales bacterium]